jgi:hypothetical protein
MTRCVISQPRFFPGLHYLHRMLVADVFVVLDTVQYNPRHEENRAKLRSPDGTQWLTVPMRRTGRNQLICDTHVSDPRWATKALRTLAHLYARAPRYGDSIDEVRAVIEGGHTTLTDLDVASWGPALDRIGTHARIVHASELDVTGRGSELLLEICRVVGADVYLSGGFGRDYLDADVFGAAGIQLEFHDYRYPSYPQRYGEFIPYLSYLDVLFNFGLDRATVLQA